MTPKSNCVGLSKHLFYLFTLNFISFLYDPKRSAPVSRKKKKKIFEKTETPATFKTFIFDYVFLHFNLFLGRKVGY